MSIKHGTIHGRFQPFHQAHLHMARLAFEQCDELTVGITNPDPNRLREEEEEPHRHRPEHNPFTYWERYRIIKTSLLMDGFEPGRFNISPFDINHMEHGLWKHYMPEDAVWFLRVKAEWGEKKKERLESHGLTVRTLPYERYTDISGTEIREKMANGGDWTAELPPGAVKVLREMEPRDRINRIRERTPPN